MREVVRQIKTVPYAAGSMSVTIPRTGYLSELFVRFNGTLDNTGTAAGTAGWRAPWALLQSARLNVNGNVFPLSADGYSLEMLGRARRPGYADNSQMGVAVGNNPVEFTSRLPIAVSDENLTGVIWVGNPDTTAELELLFREAEDPAFFTGTATLTGTVEIWARSFLFAKGEPKPDLSTLHTVTVTRQVIQATGELYVDLPTLSQMYQRIIHVIENDNAALPYTQGLQIQMQIADYESPYTWTDGELQAEQNYVYLGKLLPSTGARVIDLYRTKTLRDVVNATGLTLLQDVITIPGSVAITAPANVYTILEALVPLK